MTDKFTLTFYCLSLLFPVEKNVLYVEFNIAGGMFEMTVISKKYYLLELPL